MITLWRLLFSHKNLLEWNPSGIQKKKRSVIDYFRTMYIAPVVVLTCLIFPALTRPGVIILNSPILILWLISPFIAWSLSKPFKFLKSRLTSEQKTFLRNIARKTWWFFETFVTEGDNWLPPDNFQEQPVEVLAHRTSPTNIGLSLLANLSAYDFGYITTAQLLGRTGNTYKSLLSMERFRGHFYNWYNTRNLHPLFPTYVSTVDSGNLAGHLLTLRQGLLTLPDRKIINEQFFEGLNDTMRVFMDIYNQRTKTKTKANPNPNPNPNPGLSPSDKIALFQKEIDAVIDEMPVTLSDTVHVLEILAGLSAEIAVMLDTGTASEVSNWAHALARQCEETLNDLIFLAPWLEIDNYELLFSKFDI